MMHRIFCSLFALVLVWGTQSLQAQQPGYVVTLTGDTLRGQVHTAQKLSNPAAVEFSSEKGAKTTYLSEQVIAFGINGGDRFESFLVPRNVSPPATADMQSGRNYESPVPMLTTEQIFLRVVLTGPATLLQHTDTQSRQNFYIRIGQEIHHLKYHQYYVRDRGAVASVREYLIQLRGLLADCPELTITDYLGYNAKELSTLLKQYAACKGDAARISDRQRSCSRFGLALGGHTDLLRTNAISFPRNYGAALTLLTDFPNRNYRWSAATELWYRYYELKNTKAVMLSFIPRYRIPRTSAYVNSGFTVGKGWSQEMSRGGLYGYLTGGAGMIIGRSMGIPVYLDLRITYGAEILYAPAAFGVGFVVAVPFF